MRALRSRKLFSEKGFNGERSPEGITILSVDRHVVLILTEREATDGCGRGHEWRKKSLKIRGSDKPDRIMETFLRHIFYAGRHWAAGRFMLRAGSNEFLWHQNRPALLDLDPSTCQSPDCFVANLPRGIYEQVDSQFLPMSLVKQTKNSWRDKKPLFFLSQRASSSLASLSHTSWEIWALGLSHGKTSRV